MRGLRRRYFTLTGGLGLSALFLVVSCGGGSSQSTGGASGSGTAAGGTRAGAGESAGGRSGSAGGTANGALGGGPTAGAGAPSSAGSGAGGSGNPASAGTSSNAGASSGGAALGGAGGPSASGGAASGNGGSSFAGSGGGAGANGGSGPDTSCAASTLKSGDENLSLDVGGTSRTYVLHVPASYGGSARVPLVLDFHGLGGSGAQEQSSSGYQQIADKEGFLIAFPNGIDNAWNIGPCCTNSRDVDDLGFAKAMVTAISTAGCVDAKRVYATGFSMGGGMAQYLACNAADVFAAVTPASFDLLVPDEEPCMPSRPISVLAFRGTADTVVPFDGGMGSSGRVTFLGAQGSFARWAGIDGCMEPTTSDGDCTYYEQCDAGVEIGLCVKQGGMHAPGDPNVGWTFLNKFTLP